MTDLSRAFDGLPPKLMITKFHAFGVTERSCELLCSYFRDRYQRVKLGNSRSEWEPVLKLGSCTRITHGAFLLQCFMY